MYARAYLLFAVFYIPIMMLCLTILAYNNIAFNTRKADIVRPNCRLGWTRDTGA